MMLWSLPLFLMIFGGALWAAGSGRAWGEGGRKRAVLGGFAVASLLVSLALAVWAVPTSPEATFTWGAGLVLSLGVSSAVGVAAVVVIAIALPVVLWAAAHEPASGLSRLLGLLLAFAGAMELLVLSSDLLTLAIGWELVGGISWALIGHRWRDEDATGAASYAFNATRLGGLGLWVAAGASLAVTGGLGFDGLSEVSETAWGDAMAGGILLAAAAKSAQVPFAPWLFRAMEGPSSVSALLHSSTMVAAGAWILIRLHEPLSGISWFGPAAIALGLVTAIGGGLVAALQSHAKRLLAASTSAQYGFMFTAVGAGFAGAGLTHLVTHAALKSLLFLAAGIAITKSGSEQLDAMRLGRQLPAIAWASAIGALALAGIFPLGAAWSKEQVVAAAGHVTPWLAVAVIIAGALSAWYATRFQWLAFGPGPPASESSVHWAERGPVWGLALLSLVLGLLWLPTVQQVAEGILPDALPEGKAWELAASIGVALLAAASALYVHRRVGMVPLGAVRTKRYLADWLGLPAAIRLSVIAPVQSLATASARFDDRVVDAGPRAAVALARSLSRVSIRILEVAIDRVVGQVACGGLRSAAAFRAADERGVDTALRAFVMGLGRAATESRKIQTGSVPTYYSLLVAGALVFLLVLSVWR